MDRDVLDRVDNDDISNAATFGNSLETRIETDPTHANQTPLGVISSLKWLRRDMTPGAAKTMGQRRLTIRKEEIFP
jgi:hypothetical protein